MNFVKTVLILFAISGAANVMADGNIDLNGDGVKDSYDISTEPGVTLGSLEIMLGGNGKKFSGDFEFGDGDLVANYPGPGFDLLLDFYTHNTTLTTYSFRWHADLSDWVLYRMATWEEPSKDEKYLLKNTSVPESERAPRNFDVDRVACCVRFSDFADGESPLVKHLSDENKEKEISKDLAIVAKGIVEGGKGKVFYEKTDSGALVKRPFPLMLAYEFSTILSKSNVKDLNDLAYYLDKEGQADSSIIILKPLVDKFPDRVVAKLNLADSYWDFNMPKTACAIYKSYIIEMEQLNKSSLVTKQAMGRAQCQL
jgi:hypothetical protein